MISNKNIRNLENKNYGHSEILLSEQSIKNVVKIMYSKYLHRAHFFVENNFSIQF